jgi:hypothetical protein
VRVGRDRTHSRTVFSHPPRCHRACDFHRTRRPPKRIDGVECSVDLGKDSQAFTFNGITTHPPLKLWPFAMWTAFPPSDYYGHADFRQPHPRFSEAVSNPLLPLSLPSAEGSPMFPSMDSTRSLRWWLSATYPRISRLPSGHRVNQVIYAFLKAATECEAASECKATAG